jgi:ABC-type transport system substrate-binding protein
MLQEYVPRDHATFVRNPHYWMIPQGYPKFSTIRWNFVEDSTAAIAAVQSDSAQLTQPLAPAAAPSLKKDPNVTVLQVPSPGLFGWGFNKNTPPMNDVRVRQGLGLLLEVDQAVTNCWFGAFSPIYGGLVGSWQPYFNKTDAPQPWKAPVADRVAQANQLLQSAGWVMGPSGVRVSKGVPGLADGTPLTLNPVYQSNDTGAACASQLLPAWFMRGGVSVKPEALDPASFYGNVVLGKYSMWFSGFYGYLSWQTLMDNVVLSTSFGNPYTIADKSPALDQQIVAAEAETDPATQVTMFEAVEKNVAGLSLFWALGGQDVSVLTSSKLSGYYARLDYSNRSLITSDLLP